jgi:hypothetical protein
LKQLLPESERQGVRCHLTQKSGIPEQEILGYLNEHRDVVLTIYDTRDASSEKTKPKRCLDLSTPLVVLKGSNEYNE